MGQYEHVPLNTKLLPTQRDELQDIHAHNPSHLDDFMNNCPWVVLYVLRERVCYHVYDCPIMARHVEKLCPFSKYRDMVHMVMHSIRTEIRLSHSLTYCHPVTNERQFLSPHTRARLSHICLSIHNRVLKTYYQRQRLPLMHTLMARRGKSGKFELRVLEPVSADEDLYAQLTPQQRQNLRDKPWLSFEVMTVLYHLILSIDPMAPSISDSLFHHLTNLGVPDAAISWMKDIEFEYDFFRLGKRDLRGYTLGLSQAISLHPLSDAGCVFVVGTALSYCHLRSPGPLHEVSTRGYRTAPFFTPGNQLTARLFIHGYLQRMSNELFVVCVPSQALSVGACRHGLPRTKELTSTSVWKRVVDDANIQRS